MTTAESTREIYNAQADKWKRDQPSLLSDFSARPFLLNLCDPLQGKVCLDLGCGEGYVARELMKRGAQSTLGIDISEQMIQTAINQQNATPYQGLKYRVADLRGSTDQLGNSYDLVMAVFLFNYMSVEEMHRTMRLAYDKLATGGRLIFSVPHPSLPFLKQEGFPFYFNPTAGYFSGRDNCFAGEIWKLDRTPVKVQCVHKLLEDYFAGLKNAGFNTMPDVHELRINEEHVKLDPEFFEPLFDLPLHLAMEVTK
ncbi:class I SAM-dependent methyltransferase [bacterium]|jgi:SAM-dependent methyltransferase|nr:class I SAM-dependent methyltransferase [bacterium]